MCRVVQRLWPLPSIVSVARTADVVEQLWTVTRKTRSSTHSETISKGGPVIGGVVLT
ncbi:hypothetical protein STANM309S_03186 [Streptomyces tanashiensis]